MKNEQQSQKPTGIHAIIRQNQKAGRNTYHGLTPSEIGEYNRSVMLGEKNEAFPGVALWSRIVD